MATSETSSVESLAERREMRNNFSENADEERISKGGQGCFIRPIFQIMLVSSLVRLTIYLNKLYQDVNAVSTYYNDQDFYFAVISIAALIFPPLIYIGYLTGESLVKKLDIDAIDLSTRTVNGLLLIPWQIKRNCIQHPFKQHQLTCFLRHAICSDRHLDVLYFSAQRVCFWRKPNVDEKNDMQQMERSAETLEFFEDFYAGFIQIVLQLYIIIGSLQWKWNTVWIIGQLVGSTLSILSLILAIRRRDDGPLTGVVSFFGWVLLIIARVFVLSMVSSFFHFWTLLFCVFHAVLVTVWIYRIAIESHSRDASDTIHKSNAMPVNTRRQRVTLWLLTFWFFGFPSLLYWPIMFQLKEHRRPEKFLVITFCENVLMLCIWLVFIGGFRNMNTFQSSLAASVLVSTIVGVLFLSIYITCKPKYTDLLVLHEMKVENSHSYGIYYEFCDIVFRLPSSSKIADNLQIVRKFNENL
ncbi:hypothetical protein B4U80_07086 [Leptotrombidium deliense]|uniref:XK-related protein n=1 Tax=Leptotrombidium deliense TaxID=299467 RepID=A0A443SI52_9ACAR|nr:hypothetical protein B4U80_07086 [Leptotrombidium deliense]